jgi:hypothetical protein
MLAMLYPQANGLDRNDPLLRAKLQISSMPMAMPFPRPQPQEA